MGSVRLTSASISRFIKMCAYSLKVLLFTLGFLACVRNAENAKILGIFTLPAKSQHVLGSALLKALAARGHDVTMISAFTLDNPPKNYHDVHVDDGLMLKEKFGPRFHDPNLNVLQKLAYFQPVINFMATYVLENKNVQKFLAENDNFDVTIHLMAFNEALLGISHKLNSSVIGFSPVGITPWINYLSRNPSPDSYVPNLFLSYTNDMTFFQRLTNTAFTALSNFALHFLNMPLQRRVLQKHFPDAPSLDDLIEDINLYLINSHFTTETTRPYLSNMIRIGGYHLEDIEELPKDIKQFLDASKNGVVLFSLGSNAKSSDLPAEVIQAIINTFKKSKYNLLWKFETTMENLPKNIKLSTWLPQRAVLAHPNVKAFATHGGMGSTAESVYLGVPMICIPMFGDQRNNVMDSVKNGYAVLLEYNEITEESFTRSLNEIMNNKIYSENVKLRSDLYRNQEMNPMDKAIFWIEHVIRHKGAKHFKCKGSEIPWYQYHLLDVYAFLFSGVVIFLSIIYFAFKFVCRCFCKAFKSSENKKNKKEKVKKH